MESQINLENIKQLKLVCKVKLVPHDFQLEQ